MSADRKDTLYQRFVDAKLSGTRHVGQDLSGEVFAYAFRSNEQAADSAMDVVLGWLKGGPPCDQCGGDGEDPASHGGPCRWCAGTGKVAR